MSWCTSVGVAVALTLSGMTAGCASGHTPAGTSATTSPAESAVGALQPTGLSLVGGGNWFGGPIVADGSGAVWIAGPWETARLDPDSGATTTWTAVDDPVFLQNTTMAAATGAGVWFAVTRRVVHFDGHRMVADLAVPESMFNDSYDQVSDIAVDGDVVFISTIGGVVARWENGAWARIAVDRGGSLAVASDGALWVASRKEPLVSPGGRFEVSRFDGTTWTQPATGDGPPTSNVKGLATDSVGGVWVLADALHHFDGTSWTTVALPDEGEYASLAVNGDGDVWVGFSRSVARLRADGTWTLYGAAEGIQSEAEPGNLTTLASAGPTVFVRTGRGIFRFDGTRFESVWTAPGDEPTGASTVLAVGRDEVWTNNVYWSHWGWWRYRSGRWTAVGPQGSTSSPVGSAVLAPNGVVWAITPEGLVRFHGEQWIVMSDSVTNFQHLAVGSDGTVWAAEASHKANGDQQAVRIVGFRADGSSTTIGFPDAPQFAWSSLLLAAGPDGTLWVAAGGWGPAALARWDGAWHSVDFPSSTVAQVTDMAVSSDGVPWVTAYPEEGKPPFFARYKDGTWINVDSTFSLDLATTPQGAVCSNTRGQLICFDNDGHRIGAPIASYGSVDIAPDGAIWNLGAQLARLPASIP